MRRLLYNAGAVTFMLLGAAYLGYWFRGAVSERVLLPAFRFADSGDDIQATGSWINADSGATSARTTTAFSCVRKDMLCRESTAALVTSEDRPAFSVKETVYQVAAWNADKVVTVANERDCVGVVVTVDRRVKRIAMTRRSVDASPVCRSRSLVNREFALADAARDATK